jgi:hypothetical protein
MKEASTGELSSSRQTTHLRPLQFGKYIINASTLH